MALRHQHSFGELLLQLTPGADDSARVSVVQQVFVTFLFVGIEVLFPRKRWNDFKMIIMMMMIMMMMSIHYKDTLIIGGVFNGNSK